MLIQVMAGYERALSCFFLFAGLILLKQQSWFRRTVTFVQLWNQNHVV